jgi:pimeloyl-CoA synthetase
MSITQLSLKISQIRKEDEQHIRDTVKKLQDEGYTADRLNKAYGHCKEYDKKHGSRGNTVLMRAIEVLLPKTAPTA